MERQNKKKFDTKPAGYPLTSSTEQEVRDIFHFLLDRKFIQGDIRTLDKVPNSDGILEITDKDRFPLGKIDIQLKTLQLKNYKRPVYQVDTSLLAYCDIAVIPVILVVVNKDQKKAYWKYFDRRTLIEVAKKIKGKTVSISIPIENCIDGIDRSYITDWTKIVADAVDKIQTYDEVLDNNNTLRQSLTKLQTKLANPTDLPMQVLKEIHEFIDIYNYILDREFNFVKRYLYPNYWKIGIGVFKFDIDSFNYMLYPVEFRTNQTLVKSVKHEDYKDIHLEMRQGNILSVASKYSPDIIRESPWVYAYSSLENKITETVDKYIFTIPDEFSANEYLIGFIDMFSAYLDFQPYQNNYLLQDLKLKLYSILPVLEAESNHYADWVVEHRYFIDDRRKISNQEYHRKKIEEAIKKISEDKLPKVKVTLDSQLYNFNALKFYISWLEELGLDKTTRVYNLEADSHSNSMHNCRFWSKATLWGNFKLLVESFDRIYETCLNEYFQNISIPKKMKIFR